MKRLLPIITILALLFPSASAQKKRRTTAVKAKAPVVTTIGQAEQALEHYDFEAAESLLYKEIEALTRKKKPTTKADSLLRIAQMGAARIHATERITIIDSLVCPMEQALKAIRISQECGHITKYATAHGDVTIHENELGNKRYLAIPVADGAERATDSTAEATATTSDSSGTSKNTQASLRLAVSDKIGDGWSTPTPLAGLNKEDIAQNYPFLLTDGITLYYAAVGPESIGGYDIFVTRADDEEASFLAPENIGFPFNSPDNDYLLAIDETAQLGWLVTDRRQAKGKVCIYTFIPNETRNTYGADTDKKELSNLARITRIRDTWTDKTEVNAALQRLANLKTGKAVKRTPITDFIFTIDDQRTYTHYSDFHSNEAKKKMRQWVTLDRNARNDAILLQRLRDNYVDATNDKQRSQLAQSILKLENSHYRNLGTLETLAKEIRNAEIQTKEIP